MAPGAIATNFFSLPLMMKQMNLWGCIHTAQPFIFSITYEWVQSVSVLKYLGWIGLLIANTLA